MKIYTIGHSIHQIDVFIKFLKDYDINCVIDIRSIPFSKHVPQFNKESFKYYLSNNRIKYVFLGDELGAKRKNMSFDKINQDSIFKYGIRRIIENNATEIKKPGNQKKRYRQYQCHFHHRLT